MDKVEVSFSFYGTCRTVNVLAVVQESCSLPFSRLSVILAMAGGWQYMILMMISMMLLILRRESKLGGGKVNWEMPGIVTSCHCMKVVYPEL